MSLHSRIPFIAALPLLAGTWIASFAVSASAIAAPQPVSAASYFIVTHPDFRKCAFPICGGVFVKRVNRYFTQCADGSWQAECHAAVTDLSALGLADPAAFQSRFDASQALVRGQLTAVDGESEWPIDTLVAEEAWVGITGHTPSGSFAELTDSGIVCIQPPCESIDVAYLNTEKTGRVAEVDLAASGASDDEVAAGFEELFASGILVAGDLYRVRGPGGRAYGYRASEFYHRVSSASCSIDDASCGKGSYCAVADGLCSDGKGTCQPMPEACLEIYDPVCGCDQQTYGNACFAAASGVSVAYDGECSTCSKMDAQGVGPCDLFLGWAFDGTACIPLSGCSCSGADCGSLFSELEVCESTCEPVDDQTSQHPSR